MTFIYVISSPDHVKIGISKDPTSRLKTLQTGHPDVLSLEYQEDVDPKHARLLERIVHRTLGSQRATGEWFNISVEDAILEVKHVVMRHGDAPERAFRYGIY